jgi:hypothetical protein
MRVFRAAGLTAAAVLACSLAQSLRAQDSMPPETQAPPPAAVNRAQRHLRPSPTQPSPQAVPAPADPAPDAAPAAPPTPQWPINERPAPPTVTWDSKGLSIDAANSSLQQILKAVSVATGAKVDGMTGDQRVFGDYGPGQARDVLSQLLQGAGYNVIMVGDLGQGAPREIQLSVRRAQTGSAQAGNNSGNDDNSEDDSVDNNNDDDQQAPQPAIRPGFPGGFPRTPQQMLQEREQMIQQRQQMIQQQLQQQQQQQPQNNPQN